MIVYYPSYIDVGEDGEDDGKGKGVGKTGGDDT
jgi:hypothetical protein